MAATRAGPSGVIRVLVVSELPGARRELEQLVARDPGLLLVGACDSLESLDGLLEESGAEVVLLGPGAESHLPEPLLLEQGVGRDRIPLIVLLDDFEGVVAARALRAGARAALPHDSSPAEISAAIRGAVAGLASLPAPLVTAVLDGRTREGAGAPVDGAGRTLTPREREILMLLGEGLVNKEIGVRLGVSEHTVKTHLAAVYEKLDVSNRAEAVATGLRLGLIML